MNIFVLIKTVLDEIWPHLPGADDIEKKDLIKKNISLLGEAYNDLPSGNLVNYQNLSMRFAYVYKYVTCHANLVYEVIKMAPELRTFLSSEKIKLTSIGGGPGSDFLGILKYLMKNGLQPTYRCTMYDREKGWGECWSDVDEKLETEFKVSTHTEPFDVTDISTWKENVKYLTSDIFTMVYFMSEVAAIKSQADAFFHHLFENMKPGAFVLFIDNRSAAHYGWFDGLVRSHGFTIQLSNEGRLNIGDYDEEKTDLDRYHGFFGDPKLGGSVAYRVVQKPRE